MTLLHMDGMDLYGTDADLQGGGWTLFPTTDIAAQVSGGRFGGGCVRIVSSGYLQKNVTIDAPAVTICQFPFKVDSLNHATGERFFSVWNGGGDNECGYITISQDGSIRVYDEAGVFQGTSASGVVKENIWQYCEVKFVISDTGSITVKIDGVQVVSETGIDTNPASLADIDIIKFHGVSDNVNFGTSYDDIIIMDDNGSLNNDFLGDRAIDTLLPTGDDATDADWLAYPGSVPAGSEYTCIDDAIPGSDNKDTDYIYSSTPNDESLFDFENLPGSPAEINAVQVTSSIRKTDAGARTVSNMLKADTKSVATAFNPGTGYELWRDIWEESTESTPGSWTESLVNGAQAGNKLVT